MVDLLRWFPSASALAVIQWHPAVGQPCFLYSVAARYVATAQREVHLWVALAELFVWQLRVLPLFPASVG